LWSIEWLELPPLPRTFDISNLRISNLRFRRAGGEVARFAAENDGSSATQILDSGVLRLQGWIPHRKPAILPLFIGGSFARQIGE
jgi:hypothetical protein